MKSNTFLNFMANPSQFTAKKLDVGYEGCKNRVQYEENKMISMGYNLAGNNGEKQSVNSIGLADDVLFEPDVDSLLQHQALVESNARSYPRRLPISLRTGQGVYLTDTQGRQYIDCLAGAGALALGHSHPIVVAAVQQALAESLPWQTLDLTTPVKDQFIQELFTSLPREFSEKAKIQFCGPSGADAVEAAIKLAKTATGRRSILCFSGAYHGMTHGALSLTGQVAPKQPIAGLMPEVHFLPYPYTYRCPFAMSADQGHRISSAYIENLLSDPNSGVSSPAALILEIVQGEGGVIPAPDEWLQEIRRITQERNIPLIIDEVQTGLGRTGKMYAFEHAGIIPDGLILSKAIGGGLPVSVVIYHADLDQWSPGAHAGTFRGNQLALAAGSATIQYIREQRLDEHARDMGLRLLEALHLISEQFPCIGDVRGKGLMIGVEIVDLQAQRQKGISPPSFPALARRIQQESLRRGMIVELGGRHNSVVRFLPPLIITSDQIDQISKIFFDAVAAAISQSDLSLKNTLNPE
jgi:diaminobutyrate-2-oxoglutarate transaminase